MFMFTYEISIHIPSGATGSTEYILGKQDSNFSQGINLYSKFPNKIQIILNSD